MKYSKKQILDFYRTMLRIRLFEERIVYMYARGEVPGLAHLSIGQEACAVGTCANLREDDYISSTHRGHGHVIAKGADVKPMMAELFGKIDGYCKGKGGSMHIADMEIGILGANGIVGAGQPIAVGAALSAKLLGTDKVSVCFFGDDATNIGSFHESLNLASLMKLPAIFLCENNLYGLSTPQSKHQPITDISIRATSYDMPGVTIDGNDVFAVYEAVYKAVRRARAGEGPTLIEAKTYRWRGHHEGDPNAGERYRTKKEMEEWKKKCPILRLNKKMISERIATKKALEKIEKEITREIDAAVEYAYASEFPPLEEMYQDVFV